MTELSLNPELPSSKLSLVDPPPSHWKRPLIALFLSLVAAGLGQLYNRQPWKAFAIGLLPFAISWWAGRAGGYHHFASFLILITLQIAFIIVIALDAFRTARRQSLEGLPPWQFSTAWRVAAFLLVAAPPAAISVNTTFDHIVRARAFKVPSASMCPTVCEGERMIADPSAYWTKVPHRSDLIMFSREDTRTLWIKRVVGLPGDVVTQSDKGIMVNGKPAKLVDLAQTCGDPPALKKEYLSIEAKSVTVPPDSLYVVGDNWSNSLDSRIELFGFVSIKDVRGRPLFLYWSPYKNRIGCRLR